MTTTPTPYRLLVLLVLLVPLLGGCFTVDLDDLAKDPPVKQRFLMQVDSAAGDQPPPAQAPVLLIEQVHALSPYNGRPFVYRTGENAHQTDFYNEFLIPPAEQIGQITGRWLRDHRVFPQIIESDSPLLADLLLTIDLTELRADLRVPERPVARLALRVSLVSNGARRQVLFQRSYAATAAVETSAPEQLVNGWNAALTEVLGQLAGDLRRFAAPPGKR